MNTLSLLIYLANVIPNIGALSTFIGMIGTLLLLAIGTIWSAETNKNQLPKLKSYLVLCGIAVIISALLPDQKTIYMIAASEMGEAAVTTETGQEVFNELKDTVMYQLQQLQREKEND